MYLKSIEMLGFKSFAERTRLDFHPGVTAIVGPNGCGKSNVLDSIRWVLGEQSPKALRGSEMADVIFSGTDSRKQIGMAEVSITFSGSREVLKTEYEEVTVTRRVFRDGKGEYEINRTPCRLRDIQHLFMDTGIGRTAYSIMEQGKIDKVLSSRPDDRREIFEEAAGITKYKAQRKEALRKLEYTESNLLRLADIIREVSRQIGSLQRQANKARRYKEIHDRLREIEVRIGARGYREMTARVAEMEAAIADLDGVIAELGKKMAAEEAELEQWRSHGEEIESALEASRQERGIAVAAMERAEGQRALNIERMTDLDASDTAAAAEIASAEERLAVQRKDLDAIDGEVEAAVAELRACRDELAKAVKQMADAAEVAAKRKADVEGLRQRFSDTEGQFQALVAQIAGWDLQKRSHVLRVEAASKQLEGAKAQLEKEREGNAGVEAALSAAKVRRTEAGDEVKARKSRLREVGESLAERSRKSAEVERRLAGLKSQIELLHRMAASHEGVGSATQAVLSAAGKGALEGLDLREALADAIKIEAGAETAIGALLGDRVEALLLEDAAAVRKVLAFLKQSPEGGRLILAPTVFPRVRWRAPERSESALKFVSAEGAAWRLLEALLGHAYVADDIEGALKLKTALPHAVIATKDGHLVTQEGIIASGSAGDTARGGLLTRKREVAELESGIAKVSRELEEATAQEEAVRIQRDEADKRVEQASANLMTAEEAMRVAEREWHVWQKRRDDLQRRIEGIEGEIRHIGESGDEMGEQERAQLRRREEIGRAMETLRQEIKGVEGDLPALAARETELNGRALELRVSGAALEEKEVGLRARRAPLAALVGDLEETVKSRGSVIEANASRRAQFVEENERLAGQVEEGRAQIAQLDEYLKALQAQRTSAHEAIRAREEDLKGQRRLEHERQEERGRVDVELARTRMDRDALVSRIQRSYRIDLAEYVATDAAAAGAPTATPAEGVVATAEAAVAGVADTVGEPEPEPDWGQLEAEATQLRDRLDSMGPVNIEAITEYDELEARHRFLEEQQRDLLNSKEQLMQAIARINRTSRQLFAETFEKVARNFQETFSELFGGGRATLSLMDESDPLESGIDIAAKPPGKQLAHITLLSGGERTMTAVALLFAIYMVRPSPFCILDEMDAPLDESNIGRFIDMLKKFVVQSQFLLITHNKRTIGFADALYGVTMEESGVSKVVSVMFRSRDGEGDGAVETVAEATGGEAPPPASAA